MNVTWDERWSRRGKIAAGINRPPRNAPEGMISFVYGDPDVGSLPLEDMVTAAEYLAENNRRETMFYDSPVGDKGLSIAICNKLKTDHDLDIKPNELYVAAGASNGLSLVVDALVDPGDVVLADAPAWMGATSMFKLAGAEVIGIEVDEDGVRPDKVNAALDALAADGRGPKFLYTIPTFQNPTGVELSVDRRHELARIADERGLLILEDDAYIDLRFSGEKKPTIYSLTQPGSVLLFGTLSKTIAAGMRLGWMAGPADIIATIARSRMDTLKNNFSSSLADWYVSTGRLAEHINDLCKIYEAKRTHMLAALERDMPAGVSWTKPNGGFFIWVTFPEGIDTVALQPKCQAELVDYIPGPAFYADGSGRNSLRLSFSAVSAEEIDIGIARLGAVMKAEMAALTPVS